MIAYDDPEGKLDKTLIIIPSATGPRFHLTEVSVEALNAPHGSGVMRTKGTGLVFHLNYAIRQTLRPDSQHAWKRLFMIDDDQQFDADLLVRLLQHDKDIVVAVTCKKTPPFMPCIFKSTYIDENRQFQRRFVPYTWQELHGKKGLLPIVACGRSGILIKREVLEKLGDPWFRQGQISPGGPIGEDLDFCLRVKELGYQIYADLDSTFGHIDPVASWPYRRPDGKWTIAFQWGDGNPITLSEAPAPAPPRE
jgi:hypothetical protein